MVILIKSIKFNISYKVGFILFMQTVLHHAMHSKKATAIIAFGLNPRYAWKESVCKNGIQFFANHMVSACFPHAPQRRKCLSRLKATRGRYPESSRRVNNGKNIAIGGSITDTTQARTLYMPFISISVSHSGEFAYIRSFSSFPPTKNSPRLNSSDG